MFVARQTEFVEELLYAYICNEEINTFADVGLRESSTVPGKLMRASGHAFTKRLNNSRIVILRTRIPVYF